MKGKTQKWQEITGNVFYQLKQSHFQSRFKQLEKMYFSYG